jgi:hypothetical protein
MTLTRTLIRKTIQVLQAARRHQNTFEADQQALQNFGGNVNACPVEKKSARRIMIERVDSAPMWVRAVET